MSSNATGVGLVKTGVRHGWEYGGGEYSEDMYEGTREQILGMIPWAKRFAQSFSIEQGGAKWGMAIRQAIDKTVSDEIRIEAHRVHKSIFEPPFDGLSYTDLKDIQKHIEDKSLDDPVPAWTGLKLDVYNLALAGVTSFIVYQPVIIRTSSASTNYIFVPNYDNVGRIIAPGSIAKAVQANIPFGLPNDSSSDSQFAYGWLQHYPTYVIGSGNKAQLSAEWEYGLWSTVLYGQPVVIAK